MIMEPARHELAAATKAVHEALGRTLDPESLARAALIAAGSVGNVTIPVPMTLGDLADNLLPEIGAIVYLASATDDGIVPARVTAREDDAYGMKFKLAHPDAANARLKGHGQTQWFGAPDIFASAEHAYLYLAQQAEDMRQAVEESILTEQRLRDRFLAAAQDASIAESSVDHQEIGLRE
jgi:hypothetical protein